MTYELAKKLKEAGFPFQEQEPTLSQLIKECGDDFRGIERGPLNKSGQLYWFAGMIRNRSLVTYAESPEEAVANLWLKLNAK